MRCRYITNNLRGIPNAWHFASTSILVFTVQCVRLGGSVAHPLIGRYVNGAHLENISRQNW
ncbi:hypothetical protein F3533_23005 [Vibrio parahaemolyticus]|nr:hypothetical protein [Vibrio parahaemolyticus]EGQ9142865.1 hypothetical protein [Vibrio parahaemolyticus]EGR2813159.1 hypothetical protein [Vibrio parahaemolyticus]EGR3228403.1 hypothetical protein [Vibrio parahaemolyticus]